MKMDKLDKLSRALQQERVELQTTIKSLSKTPKSLNENEPGAPPAESNGHELEKSTDSVLPSDTVDGSLPSDNLYGQ